MNSCSEENNSNLIKTKNLISKKSNSDDVLIYPENDEKFYLSYYKTKLNLQAEKDIDALAKATESLIRNSDEYKHYISHLKNDYGLNHCMIRRNITDDAAKIEMHHGPIFTLFDYVTITMIFCFKNNIGLSSFRLFDIVLKDHWSDLIQTVMLCKAEHEKVHNKNLSPSEKFLVMDFAYGDLLGYIQKYNGCFTNFHINKLKKYLHEMDLYNKNTEKGTFFKEKIEKINIKF